MATIRPDFKKSAPKIQVFFTPTTINWWDIVNVPILTSNSFIPRTCSSSPPILLAFKEDGFKGPLMSSRLINDTVAPVSTKHFCSWAPIRVLMKTAVGRIQFMGKAVFSWTEPRPSNGSVLGRFPDAVDQRQGTGI